MCDSCHLPNPPPSRENLSPAVHYAFSPIPWLWILEPLRCILTPHSPLLLLLHHSSYFSIILPPPLRAVGPLISSSPLCALLFCLFVCFWSALFFLSSTTLPILFSVGLLGLAASRLPDLSPSARSSAPRRPCGATRGPNASAMACRAHARCAPAGRSCPHSARWARGCSSASTAPRVSWAPTTARLCCPLSARSSRRAALTYCTPPTRPTSAPPTGAPVRRARAAAPATAVPRTSAAATCCAAAAATARRACSSRRTVCAASTGAA